ncbi:assimilatory nitrate reductase (NADH) beta subunit [Raineyella antarctica]|uniref:Assimilatory nitrate reductase (NADH) beta subunit n=1 Tax=Raineyella antarctica TaxID=1577474 RepID=A0A1G6GGG5_9ACTN|nr:FAD-dependent oxidoreductase [Raineyella antarctica]SDB80835.1 assimilatory nitrate reductase (NADH) beta subunit [Raineyella antarctica]
MTPRHVPREGDHLVVIGFGPVAWRLVDDLLPEVEAGRLRITVLGDEPSPAYNRVLVGEVATGKHAPADLDLVDVDDWTARGVLLRLGTRAGWIDRAARLVHLEGDQAPVPYDLLVLAVGARANVPRLAGLNPDPEAIGHLPPGISVLRTLDEATRVHQVVADGGRVVVLGGGVLGLEVAAAARDAGCAVTVVHNQPWLLTRSTDSAGGALLGGRCAGRGLVVEAGVRARAVRLGEGRRFRALVLEDGREVLGDVLVLSVGVSPRTRLARGAGLVVNHGIVVNHELEADTEARVFAIGDCAEVWCEEPGCGSCRTRGRRPPSGLVGPGWDQARWLAARLRADLGEDPGPLEPLAESRQDVVRLKAEGIEFVAGGDLAAEPWDGADDGRDSVVWADSARRAYLKVVVEDERVVGFCSIGLPRSGAELAALYGSGEPAPADLAGYLFPGTPECGPGGAAGAASAPEATLCRCAGVSVGAVREAIDAGADDVDRVRRATRAGSGCGGCRSGVEALLAAIAQA